MGIVWKRSFLFEPKWTGPLLERLQLRSPETLSAYSTGRCGSALKLKEINFFEPKWTGPLLERLRLKSPEILSAYSTGRCGSALKLPCSELTVANNLWQLLFYKLTNCSHSTCVQYYKLLNLWHFSGILKHLKLSKFNSAFNHFFFFLRNLLFKPKRKNCTLVLW